jgi:hypothetical protein
MIHGGKDGVNIEISRLRLETFPPINNSESVIRSGDAPDSLTKDGE